jgi:hypothetical protein
MKNSVTIEEAFAIMLNLYREQKNDLERAIQYLREGKAKYAPNTTNSFVDELIAKYSEQEAGK